MKYIPLFVLCLPSLGCSSYEHRAEIAEQVRKRIRDGMSTRSKRARVLASIFDD